MLGDARVLHSFSTGLFGKTSAVGVAFGCSRGKALNLLKEGAKVVPASVRLLLKAGKSLFATRFS